ncbi:metal ABC transporter ATP-binding protein [Kiloniella sp. b19]|uniref:metal ABC transporter ATP-binding protein n=1 Tax=Kiloniella sp. GXU_MW_B19 TaxID=3141326 RepID=UPI0031CEFB50
MTLTEKQDSCGCGMDHSLPTEETEMLGEILVSMNDVSVRFDGQLTLDRISLKLHKGEVITLIGPNGAGKSTLLKTLLGTQRNHSGQVWRRDELSIGYVPQKLNIDPGFPMTVERFLSVPQRHPLKNRKAMLERVGALHCLQRPVQALSGGEFQRVLLARALLRKPDLMVLDEPVQGVDFHGQTALYNLITDLHEEYGFGVLMVSHDLHVVMASTNKVVCLNKHICCTGAPRQVSDDPEYRALFGGQMQDGLAVYHHRHNHSHH